jgi:L-lactate utilization protein LutC
MNFFKKMFNLPFEDKKKVVKQEVSLALDDLFVHNFIKKGGKFLYCLKESEVKENVIRIFSENNWNSTLVTNTKLLPFLNEGKIATSSIFNKSIPFFTTCEHLIAEHGDVLFSSNQLSSIKLSEYSDNFIIYATTSQLVKNSSEGLTGIKINYKYLLPTNISSIKNYNLNKNDDNFLNYGYSTAKNLYLLLLEDL